MGHLCAVNHSTSSGANVGANLYAWAQLPTTGPRTDRDLVITGHWPRVGGRVASAWGSAMESFVITGRVYPDLS